MQLRGFGDLEAVVMNAMWDRGESATVRDIFDTLTDDRRIAYTTVMSTMDNLHRKGWLQREQEGRAYRYQVTLSREEHSAQLMRAAFNSGGDTELVLSFFLDQMDDEASDQARDALRRILRRRRR
ncbi:MAG: BlaI/MecI/CopY family transcriptional regulator [Mycobacterium sp.]|jgi:predicted transcriptional regulator|nr:BlaI/MecI/CopY family transcriptional regulator [Mycobacterium sp.]